MSLRSFLGEHFGAENILWTRDEGPEPNHKELQRRSNQAMRRERPAGCDEIAAVRRTLHRWQCGLPTGLTPDEEVLLPELLAKLEAR